MNDNDTDSEPMPPPPATATLFAAVVPALFVGMIDQTIVASALPDITRDLGGIGTIGMVVTAYLAAAAISAPVYGRLGDALGRRKMISVALVITFLGSLLCMIAPSFPFLIAARGLQGLGGGGLIVLSHALIGQYVGPRRRAAYQGYLASVAIVASTIGPVVGGFITSHIGWPWIFALNLPLAMFALILVQRLPRRLTPRGPLVFDWIGLSLFAILTILVIAQFESIKSDAATPAYFAGAVLALVLLIWRERCAQHPLFPGDLLANRSISLAALLAMCHGALYVTLITYIPIYFSVSRGLTAQEIGLMMLPITVGVGLGSFFTGQMISRNGYTMIYPTVGLLCAGTLLIGLSYTLSALSDLEFSLFLMAVSISLGSIMGVVQITVQIVAGNSRLGTASSLVSLARSSGAVAGTALVGAAVGAKLLDSSFEPNQVFSEILFGGALLALAASLIAAAVPRRRI